MNRSLTIERLSKHNKQQIINYLRANKSYQEIAEICHKTGMPLKVGVAALRNYDTKYKISKQGKERAKKIQENLTNVKQKQPIEGNLPTSLKIEKLSKHNKQQIINYLRANKSYQEIAEICHKTGMPLKVGVAALRNYDTKYKISKQGKEWAKKIEENLPKVKQKQPIEGIYSNLPTSLKIEKIPKHDRQQIINYLRNNKSYQEIAEICHKTGMPLKVGVAALRNYDTKYKISKHGKERAKQIEENLPKVKQKQPIEGNLPTSLKIEKLSKHDRQKIINYLRANKSYQEIAEIGNKAGMPLKVGVAALRNYDTKYKISKQGKERAKKIEENLTNVKQKQPIEGIYSNLPTSLKIEKLPKHNKQQIINYLRTNKSYQEIAERCHKTGMPLKVGVAALRNYDTKYKISKRAKQIEENLPKVKQKQPIEGIYSNLPTSLKIEKLPKHDRQQIINYLRANKNYQEIAEICHKTGMPLKVGVAALRNYDTKYKISKQGKERAKKIEENNRLCLPKVKQKQPIEGIYSNLHLSLIQLISQLEAKVQSPKSKKDQLNEVNILYKVSQMLKLLSSNQEIIGTATSEETEQKRKVNSKHLRKAITSIYGKI